MLSGAAPDTISVLPLLVHNSNEVGLLFPLIQKFVPILFLVFYKNQIAMSTTYLNLYMVFGGTNWGKLPTRVEFLHQLFLISFAGGIAHPGVYTSYDYVSLELPFLL